MVRVPCCERMGMKKGPWTAEEDQILISYIQRYGHENWRALPKQAGLLRCGKSCRLRWTNYLRPDIKRGNFSKEEEETIFKLHQMLGNRWSAIATKLPGRTDNEIKNYWHTHLKKRAEENPGPSERLQRCSSLQTSVLRSNNQRLIPEIWINSNHPGNFQKINGYNSHYSVQPKHFGFFTLGNSSAAAAMQSKEGQILQANSSESAAETNHEKISAQEFSLTNNKSKAAFESRAQILSTTGKSVFQSAGDECNNSDMLFWYNLFVNAGKPQESQEQVA